MGLPPIARRIVSVAAWPVRRYFGTQFTWTRSQVVETDHRLHSRLDAVSATIDELVARRVAAIDREMQALRGEIGALRNSVEMTVLASSEALADVGNELRLMSAALGVEEPERDGPPAGPYVMRAIAPAQPGSRVLVLGVAGGPVAAALASLGYSVTAIGAASNGARHPDVVAGADRIEGWRPPAEPFDAVIAVDALDPLAPNGGESPSGSWIAQRSLERLRHVVREGGRLVLTSTVDTPAPGKGASMVPQLTDGWLLEDCTLAEQAVGGTWSVLPTARPPKAPGRRVLLVTARAVGEG